MWEGVHVAWGSAKPAAQEGFQQGMPALKKTNGILGTLFIQSPLCLTQFELSLGLDEHIWEEKLLWESVSRSKNHSVLELHAAPGMH